MFKKCDQSVLLPAKSHGTAMVTHYVSHRQAASGCIWAGPNLEPSALANLELVHASPIGCRAYLYLEARKHVGVGPSPVLIWLPTFVRPPSRFSSSLGNLRPPQATSSLRVRCSATSRETRNLAPLCVASFRYATLRYFAALSGGWYMRGTHDEARQLTICG